MIDVKYKQPDDKAVLISDVYQAVAYANRFDLTAVTLVYAGPPPYERLTIGDVTVALDWVDLANPEGSLDGLSAQIERTKQISDS